MLWPLVLVATLLLLTLRQVTELDIFYHLANGRSILEAGSIPRDNLFVFVETPGFYPNPSWLFGVLAMLVHSLAGIPGLVIGKALLVAAMFAVLSGVLRRQGASWPATCFWLWLVAMSCVFRFTERPHLFSHLLFALFVLVEQQHRERGGRCIFWLLPLAALWANLHAGVVLGVAWLALRLVGDLVPALLHERWPRISAKRPPKERLLRLGLTTLGAAAALFLTPTPLAIPRMILGSSGIDSIFPITEYLAPTPAAHPWFFLLVIVLLVLLAIRPRTVDAGLLLPALAFLLLSLNANRFIADFAIVATPLAAARWKVVANALKMPSWLGQPTLQGAGKLLLPLVLLAIVLVVPPVPGHFGFEVNRYELPAGALRFLDEQPLNGKLYNSLGHSGVGMFFLYPRYPLYQTSFFQVESERIIEAGLANRDPESWRAFLDKYQIAIAFIDITREQHSVRHFPPDQWALVYFDDLSAVFLRRDSGNKEVIDTYELQAAHPVTFLERGGMMGGISQDYAAVAVTELQRVLNWDDFNHMGHLMQAGYLRVLERFDDALQHYDRAIDLHPGSGIARFQRGLLRRMGGDLQGAEEDLRQAVKADPGAVTYWSELGVTLGMQGEYEEAISAFDQALNIDPVYQAALENREHAQWLWKGKQP